MADRAPVTLAGFVPAPPRHKDPRLAGFVQVVVADLVVLDGVALRRRDGCGFELRFPSRVDNCGVRRHFVRPKDDRARAEIEKAVLEALVAVLQPGEEAG